MTRQIRIFLTALQFFTRIPISLPGEFSEDELNRSIRYFSLVGLLVGAVSALIFWGSLFIVPRPLAIILSMIASVLMTGGLHEDGFADVCDGFGGGWSKEDVLTIMKDSRIGTFGSLGLILMVGMKFFSLNEVDPLSLPLVIVAGHGVSRFFSSVEIYISRYVYRDDRSKAKPLAETVTRPELIISAIFGLMPLVFLDGYHMFSVFPLLGVLLLMNDCFTKRIGGYTGDCLGAVQQVIEVLFYLIIVADPWKFIL